MNLAVLVAVAAHLLGGRGARLALDRVVRDELPGHCAAIDVVLVASHETSPRICLPRYPSNSLRRAAKTVTRPLTTRTATVSDGNRRQNSLPSGSAITVKPSAPFCPT